LPTLKKEESKRVLNKIRTSKAAIKYSLNIKKYVKDQVVNASYFKDFKNKEALLNYVQKDRKKKNFVSVIKLKSFCFKLPEDSIKEFFLTLLSLKKKLRDIYFISLKIFLLSNSQKEMSSLLKNNDSKH
jgi:hypothetical protein